MLDKNEHNLCVKLPKELVKDLQTEVINKYGNTYGNTGKCIKEAIIIWIEKSKKERGENR